jgi:mono/diheme cytochrome c family protein
MSRRRLIALCVALAAAATGGCKLFEFYAEARSTRMLAYERAKPDRQTLGVARFAFDEFGGLSTYTLQTNAMPWKLVGTALVLDAAAREGLPVAPETLTLVLRRYGWIFPTAFDNWPAAVPQADTPLGLVTGDIHRTVPRVRLQVANIGCAACHAGMNYDATGNATGRVWLGAPNTSRYFDAYLQALGRALRYARDHHGEILPAVPKVFPDVHADELATLDRFVLKRVLDNPQELEANLAALAAFDHGGPGITNGVAALKLRLNARPPLVSAREHGYTSIPDLHGRALRSSFLYDGFYAADAAARFAPRAIGERRPGEDRRVASIVAFFLVPSMGIDPARTERYAGRVQDVLVFLDEYRPPPFPGPIDRDRAARGGALFDAHCAGCHGTYVVARSGARLLRFPNRPIAQSQMNTDPERWRAMTPALVQALDATPVARQLNPRSSSGYVAPILSGLWISAPYLHNGSVPTLWHLMRPGERPRAFMAGGHRLDYGRVGIDLMPGADGVYRFPAGYRPWSEPALYDTARPGKGSGGHEAEFAPLSEAEKDDLLEFLKQL